MDTNLLRKLQIEELDMLKVIIEICNKYDLKYYALGGTLLGAVRHGGFIPWDDDIDIGMPRDDYEKFLKYAEYEFKNHLSIHSMNNDEKYIYPYARVENSKIALRREKTKNKTIQMLWVDIFPIDGSPNNIFVRKIWEKKLLVYRAVRNLSCFDELVNIEKEHKGIEKILFKIGLNTNIQKYINTHKVLMKIDKLLKKYPLNESNYIGNSMGAHKFKEIFPKDYYNNIISLKFEDITINCPEKYVEILSQMYGDYMQLPDSSQRNWHGNDIAYWN